MFKKKLVALSAIMIAGLMTFQANVSADAVEEKPYLSDCQSPEQGYGLVHLRKGLTYRFLLL